MRDRFLLTEMKWECHLRPHMDVKIVNIGEGKMVKNEKKKEKKKEKRKNRKDSPGSL